MLNIFSKKKDKESEISIANVMLIIFAIVSIFYTIIVLVKNAMEKPTIYNINNIKEYVTEENLVKTDYFYALDSQVANFLTAVDNEMYFELYQIFIDDYKKIYSKNKVTETLKQYKNDIFTYNQNERKDHTGHLINAYKIKDDTYLLQLDFNNGEFYMIMQNELKKYNFAILE